VSACVSLLSLLGKGSVNCIPLSLLGNNSVKTFPRQGRIVGRVVFYAIRVVSKESRRLVLPRTSCSSDRYSLFTNMILVFRSRGFDDKPSLTPRLWTILCHSITRLRAQSLLESDASQSISIALPPRDWRNVSLLHA
jgi:hypothetical protein